MDVAFMQTPEGDWVVGFGPFEARQRPPQSLAFYVNDFMLTDPAPWKVPASSKRGPRLGDLLDLDPAPGPPRIEWQPVEKHGFKMAYRRVRREIRAGQLEKLVPVVTQRGRIVAGDPRTLVARLEASAEDPARWGYGCWGGDSGFIGASPERLFTMSGRLAESMALAGTARDDDRDAFAADPKEVAEHELVVGYLDDVLGDLGHVRKGDRQLLDAGSLLHLCTPFEVDLGDDVGACAEWIERLHPTPALGCLPRSAHAIDLLHEYRRTLGVPGFFGAPFGFSDETGMHILVAIRGIGWQGDEFQLPAGCGIIGSSVFDHEMREIQLKHRAVRQQLGL